MRLKMLVILFKIKYAIKNMSYCYKNSNIYYNLQIQTFVVERERERECVCVCVVRIICVYVIIHR
jgi:hypothetical protein